MDITYKALDSVYDVRIGSMVEIDGVRGMVTRMEVLAPNGQAGWPIITVQSHKDGKWMLDTIHTNDSTVVAVAVAA